VQSVSRPRVAPAVAAALAAAALAAALLALALSGALSHHAAQAGSTAAVARAPAAPDVTAFDGTLAGAPLQRASCASWLAASPAERTGAVASLRGLVGGASTTGGVGTTMSDAAAFQLFDTQCATPATRNFVLYVMYARAAAFR
jgi:hypothetical protein